MGAFTTAWAAAAARLAEQFGQAATYTPPGGGATSACTVIVDTAGYSDFAVAAETADVARQTAMIDALVDEVTPARFGTFTIGTDVWTISDPPQLLDGAVWQCPAARQEALRATPTRAPGR